MGAVLALLALLGSQLLRYGPTIDPDLDGYISYAEALATTWQIQEHRRLPGYPFLIAVTHSLFGGAIQTKMFWVHFVLLIGFAAATTGIAWRYFGYAVAIVYLAILSWNSHFALNSIVMLADFPFVVSFWLTCALAALLWMKEIRPKLVLAALFFAGCFVSTSLHPSANMRIQILVFVSAAVLLVRAFLAHRANIKPIVLNAVTISAISLAANASALATLQLHGKEVTLNAPSLSSSVFLQQWVSYRMLLCLPAPANASASDLEIEKAKARFAVRHGVTSDQFVPPGHHQELAELFQKVPVHIDQWRLRLREHPLKPVECALNEVRAKYHTILRNITPFTNFASRHKTFVTLDYPPNSGSFRDTLFWTSGLNLLKHVEVDAPAARVLEAAVLEIGKILLALLVTIGGLILLERRFSMVGWIVGLSTLVLMFVLALALPLETRYLGPVLPILYLGQAMFLVYVLEWCVNLGSSRWQALSSGGAAKEAPAVVVVPSRAL